MCLVYLCILPFIFCSFQRLCWKFDLLSIINQMFIILSCFSVHSFSLSLSLQFSTFTEPQLTGLLLLLFFANYWSSLIRGQCWMNFLEWNCTNANRSSQSGLYPWLLFYWSIVVDFLWHFFPEQNYASRHINDNEVYLMYRVSGPWCPLFYGTVTSERDLMLSKHMHMLAQTLICSVQSSTHSFWPCSC